MLRRPAPSASRRRPVQENVRTRLRHAALVLAAAATLPAAAGPPAAAIAPAAGADLVPRARAGQILYVLNPTTVRTRGGGNLGVDLPRGRALVLVSLGPDRALLEDGPADAALLRAHGVRRTPRYTATPAQVAADLVPGPVWDKARAEGARRIAARWPDLTATQAERIFLGQPFTGMTLDQAEEAVGPVVLARSSVPGENGALTWTVGRRPRSAELRAFTEAREPGRRPATFDEYLSTRTRAILIFNAGILTTIAPPHGVTPGLHWP